MPDGIMITGPSGSGRTTLGIKVAGLLGFPFFDVDDYIWKADAKEPYTVMYSREEKISRLKDAIAPFENFVMAGSMSSFHEAFDSSFRMIVFLYADPGTREGRLRRRSCERFGERVLEGGDLWESNERFIAGNGRYETDGSPNLREQKEWISGLGCIKMELDGRDSVEKNAALIAGAWNDRHRPGSCLTWLTGEIEGEG